MKIGILTHPLETNYGCLLQAFALQKVLTGMGHDVYVIDWHHRRPEFSFPRRLVKFLSRCFRHYVLGRAVSPCWSGYPTDEEYAGITRNLDSFLSRIRRTEPVRDDGLGALDEKYRFDAYVVGSDQVWKPGYCPQSFLDFVHRDGVIKLSYAASAPRQSWLDIDGLRSLCAGLSTSFRALSAREKQLAVRASAFLGRPVAHVLDPVLLIPASDFPSDFPSGGADDGAGHVFSYILDSDDRKKSMAEALSERFGCKVVSGNPPCRFVRGVTDVSDCVFPSVEDWISHLSDADFVITDSFHGVAMSILFNRQFAVCANESRGSSRFDSILSLFGLESRAVLTVEDALRVAGERIDYSKINGAIMKEREKSLAFLTGALSDEKI